MSPSGSAALWTGRVLSALTVVVLLLDGGIDLVAPGTVAAQMAETGYPPATATPLGLIVVACAILYAVPRTAVVGAILTSGFVGGAVATHFRLGEIGSPPQLISVAIGVVAWAGLVLRDARLRAAVLSPVPW